MLVTGMVERMKKRRDLKVRMSQAYKRNKRQKKIDKLMSDEGHWSGLS